MASAQSLVSDKLNEDMENKASGDSRSCSFCKRDSSNGNISENPVHTWLSMDAEDREKHLKHMKNCILTPFLFGKRMNYSSKNITWLKRLRLIPTTRHSCSRSCLSDRLIGVADLVEEIVDTILSCLVSEEFLHNSYHTYKELTECCFVEEALLIGKRSEFVSLMGYCFNGNHCVDHKRIQLLSLTVLHQAMKHICQTIKHGDCLTKYEEAVKRREPACIELRLKGNDHFAVGEYQTAVACYSQAIKFSPFDPLLYGNRAQSYLKLKKLREALSDAKRAVYLKPEWEKGHYRFAQAYFELGFPEKAMAVNTFAQKCCSSTFYLLCQAVVFKREMEESANRNKVNCCSSREGQTASNCHQHHEACCENPGPSKTIQKVGSKRNWNVANQTDTLDPVLNCAVKKDTDKHEPPSVGEDDNCNPCCDKDEDSDLELSDDDFIPRLKNYSSDNSDDDSIPPLIYDSSNDDDDDDDDDDDSSWLDNSDLSDLPRLASCDESDTESDSEFDIDLDDDDDDSYCSDVDCSVCNCCHHGDVDADNGDHVNTDSDTGDDGDSDESGDNLDILRSLMFPSILNNEISPFLVFDVIRAFLTAHPEMVNEGSPPALPEVIESLPKAKVTKEQVAVSASCAICRCDYEESETVLVLPCSHLFHPPCITTWLKMHATCPTCRDVLPH